MTENQIFVPENPIRASALLDEKHPYHMLMLKGIVRNTIEKYQQGRFSLETMDLITQPCIEEIPDTIDSLLVDDTDHHRSKAAAFIEQFSKQVRKTYPDVVILDTSIVGRENLETYLNKTRPLGIQAESKAIVIEDTLDDEEHWDSTSVDPHDTADDGSNLKEGIDDMAEMHQASNEIQTKVSLSFFHWQPDEPELNELADFATNLGFSLDGQLDPIQQYFEDDPEANEQFVAMTGEYFTNEFNEELSSKDLLLRQVILIFGELDELQTKYLAEIE